MAENHVRDTMSQVNPNEPFSIVPNLPLKERKPISSLAEAMGIAPRTLRDWVERYDCPFKQTGDEMWVDTEDLWNSWPYQRPAEEPRKPRGGRRKKKELPAEGPATTETGGPGA